MGSVNFEIDGVSVQVWHEDINNKPEIKCKGCGRRKIKISDADIKEVSPVNRVKITFDLAKKLLPIFADKSLDFLKFMEKWHIWNKSKNDPYNRELGLLEGVETSISKSCPLCKIAHVFKVSINNPLEVSFDLPDLIKEFSARGIQNNSRTLDILTPVCYRPYAGDFETPETFLSNIEALNQDISMVREFMESVIKSLDAYKFKSELANTWTEDLKTSLTEVSNILMKDLIERLERDLKRINHEIETSAGVIEY